MNAAGKHVDKTFLSIDNAEERGFIHRDYIAHCLRWTHVCKYLYGHKRWQTARILDIGCGRELPLAKLLYSSKLIPEAYIGVDVGPVNDEAFNLLKGEMKNASKIFEQTNMLELSKDDLGELANVVTCFEVLEHVEPKMMMEMLERVKVLTSDDCVFFFSTPCWNRRDCAANHVNEMLYDSLGAVFERHGFVIEEVYGTFASISDYGHLLTGDSLQLFNKLRAYYDTNFLSCVFAPLFPAQSRNALWRLRKHTTEDVGQYTPRFPHIRLVPEPWSSSEQWLDMAL